MELNKYEKFLGIKKNEIVEDWDDFDFVLSKVKQNGYALYYASDELKNNEEIVKEAVKQKGLALKFASKRLQDDEEIVREAIKQDEWAFPYVSEKLKNNEEIVKIAIRKNEMVLKFASYDLQKEFIAQTPELIQYITQTPELIKIAIDSGLKDRNLIYISKEKILEYIKESFPEL